VLHVVVDVTRPPPHPSYVPDDATLATIASLITAAGVTMLFFRVQREEDMRRRGETSWFPKADRLLLAATFTSIILVLLPILLFRSGFLHRRVPTAGCVTAVVALGGYPFALLAHYRLLIGRTRTGGRENPEPAERMIIRATTVLALVLFATSLATSA
jgi:hypothetical protein